MSDRRLRIRSANDFKKIQKGSLLKFKRSVYSHWAVYIGNGKICHLTRDPQDSRNNAVLFTHASAGRLDAVIRVDDLSLIIGEASEVYVDNTKDSMNTPDSADMIVERALSKLGKSNYSLTTENCEHFATWCRYGESESKQVENVAIGSGVALGVAAVVGGAIALAAIFLGSSRDNKDKQNECKLKRRI